MDGSGSVVCSGIDPGENGFRLWGIDEQGERLVNKRARQGRAEFSSRPHSRILPQARKFKIPIEGSGKFLSGRRATQSFRPRWLLPSLAPGFWVPVDETRFADFAGAVEARLSLSSVSVPEGKEGMPLIHVFLVTDSEEAFREMARQLKVPHVIRLYRDYLENFVINKGDGS